MAALANTVLASLLVATHSGYCDTVTCILSEWINTCIQLSIAYILSTLVYHGSDVCLDAWLWCQCMSNMLLIVSAKCRFTDSPKVKGRVRES